MTRQIVLPALVAIALTACGGGSSPAPMPSPQATPPAPVATATVAGPRTINGLFTEPRPSPPDETRRLGPQPENFPVWNGTSTMIYDLQSNKATDLGPGSLGRFSPDSTRIVWIAGPSAAFEGGEAWMVDLRTLQKRDLGPGRLTGFIDDTHVGVTRPSSNTTDIIDLGGGVATATSGSIPFFTDWNKTSTPDGYLLQRSGLAPDETNSISLTDPRTGAGLLQFQASEAVPAGHGALAVAATSVPAGPADSANYRHATTNIFLVDVASGQATFVATGNIFGQFTLVADDNYVVWTDNYCDGGHTRIFDRESKKIKDVEASLAPVAMANGLILEGVFGGRALIDPATLQYRAALPPGVGDTSWSPDYRYASLGQFGGHGGLCG